MIDGTSMDRIGPSSHPDGYLYVTRSTYRLQLHGGFTFKDAAAVVPHLAALGVTHVYASPIFQAVPGSTHGYDVADPTRLNEELGGAGGFAALLDALRTAGLGLVVDIVPNHMAADPVSPWWWDVLENGPSSVNAPIFDIDWYGGREGSSATVLVPILGDHYGRVLDAGEITIEREAGSCVVRYHEHRLPLSPSTLDDVLSPAARAAGSPVLAELAEEFAGLPAARATDSAAVSERHRRKDELRRALAELVDAEPEVAAAIDAELGRIGADPDRLDALLRRQNYRLARWQTATDEIDYRRFFTIEALVGVRVEDPAVFDATHAFVLELVRDGSINGLRVDHVDGLRDPTEYLERLAVATDGVPTVVEKILERGEELPSWPVEGTTGYDFLARVDQLFVDRDHEEAMTQTYADTTGAEPDFDVVVLEAKRQIVDHELVAEVDRATELLGHVCEDHRRHRDHTRRELRAAVAELTASFDVYRTYWRPGHDARPADLAVLERAASRAQASRPEIDPELLRFLTDLAGGRTTSPVEDDLALRLQQLSAPVMAKGVEDTAFYRYHRLIALNEVGNDPGTFGTSVDEFHEVTSREAERWPDAMLTLSTHDTKRSADVRSRLAVLAEEPEVWRHTVERWIESNARHWGGAEPDHNTEYLLYQTLLGAWPLDADRTTAFLLKAVREAKVHTSWTESDEGYEAHIEQFARGVLSDPSATGLIEQFLTDTDLVGRGRRTALARAALLLTSPGHPDLYQGGERWDLSLTDPDNRRPVDFDAAYHDLVAISGLSIDDVLRSDVASASKIWLTHRLLHLRAERPALFDGSGYEPIEVAGARSEVVAFRRGSMVVIVSVRSTMPPASAALTLGGGPWRHVLDGRTIDGGTQKVNDLLASFPVAVLTFDDAE